MVEIDYYCFPLSPYSYLAGLELEEIAGRNDARITYKPIELMRIFAQTGTLPVNERHSSRQQYRLADIGRVAEAKGLPVNIPPAHFPTNPVPASAAIVTAQDAGGGDVGRLLHCLLRAVWAEDRDIAEDAVIGDCLSEAGFDPALASRGMLSGVEVLQRNTEEALKRGVFGAPTYVIGDALFWGQDRLPHLEGHLKATST